MKDNACIESVVLPSITLTTSVVLTFLQHVCFVFLPFLLSKSNNQSTLDIVVMVQRNLFEIELNTKGLFGWDTNYFITLKVWDKNNTIINLG